jgi:hypothetical protein
MQTQLDDLNGLSTQNDDLVKAQAVVINTLANDIQSQSDPPIIVQ